MLSFSYKDILNNPNYIHINNKKGKWNFSNNENHFNINTDIRFKYKKIKKFSTFYSQLPSSFDSSKNPLTTNVMNQGNCGCCFAISTSTAISDVFSIGMNMTFNPYISTMYILSSISGHKKCDGGNPYEILEKIENEGIATNICVSYENACLDYGNCDNNMIPSKGCCNNQVDHYLYFISNIRVETDINLIKQHIYKYGCVIGGFTVYQSFEDFGNNYGENGFSDIYIDKGTDINEKPLGFHAICIIGWGNDNGIDYWLCRNSWGEKWGNNGYFKFALYNKGINERNALEKIYNTDDGDIGGIILFEPDYYKKSDLPLSDCNFLNNLDTKTKNKLISFYGQNENDPKNKSNKSEPNKSEPKSEPNKSEAKSESFFKKYENIFIIIFSIFIIIILIKLLF